VVVAVSCNVATFARDARILIDGGFQIEGVTPVDQFRHTPPCRIGRALQTLKSLDHDPIESDHDLISLFEHDFSKNRFPLRIMP